MRHVWGGGTAARRVGWGCLVIVALGAPPALAAGRLEAARKEAVASKRQIEAVVVRRGAHGEQIERRFSTLSHLRGKHLLTTVRSRNGAERRIDEGGILYTRKVALGEGSTLIKSVKQGRDQKTGRFKAGTASYYLSKTAKPGAKVKPGEFVYEDEHVRRLDVR